MPARGSAARARAQRTTGNRKRWKERRFWPDAALLRGQWRVGPEGAYGLDHDAALSILARRGHDPDIAALLLPYWEAGGLQAFAEMREEAGESR